MVIFLPLLGLIYFGMQTFKGNSKTAKNVVTDSINMSLPEARSEGMDDKMTAMNKRFAEGGAFTAVFDNRSDAALDVQQAQNL